MISESIIQRWKWQNAISITAITNYATSIFGYYRSIYMKTLITVLVILASVVGILRINLPSNDIDEQLATNSEASFLEKAITGMMFSDSVADWQYIDLVVVKFACSERLEMTLIAIPFKRWQSYDEKRSICHDD